LQAARHVGADRPPVGNERQERGLTSRAIKAERSTEAGAADKSVGASHAVLAPQPEPPVEGDHNVVGTWMRQTAGVSIDSAMRFLSRGRGMYEAEADRAWDSPLAEIETKAARRHASERPVRAGDGERIEPQTRARLEQRMQADFSDVRVHTDPRSSLVAATLGARAFTLGRHIAFAGGEYRPGTAGGERLLTHELTHALQQGGATAAPGSPAARVSAAPVGVAAKPAPFAQWVGIVATEADPLTARTLPDPNSEARGKFPKGGEVEVVGGHPETWLLVTGENEQGVVIERAWVLGRLVKPKAGAPEARARTARPPHTPAVASRAVSEPAIVPWPGVVATQKDPLTIRSRPDPTAPSRGAVDSGEQVQVVGGRRSTWLIINAVTTEGVRVEGGYVLGRMVTPAPPPVSPSAPPTQVVVPPSAQPPEAQRRMVEEPIDPEILRERLRGGRSMLGYRVGGIGMTPGFAGGTQALGEAAYEGGAMVTEAVLTVAEAVATFGKQKAIDAVIAALKGAQAALVASLRKMAAALPAPLDVVADSIVDAVEVILDILITIVLAIFGIIIGLVEGLAEMVVGVAQLAWTIIALVADLITGIWSKENRRAFEERGKAILEGLKGLPNALWKTYLDWKDRFSKATPDQGTVMIGELTGRIMALILSFYAGGGVASMAPKVAVPTIGFSVSGGTLALTRTGTVMVSAATPGVAVGFSGGALGMLTTGSGDGPTKGERKQAEAKDPGRAPEVDKALRELNERGKNLEAEAKARRSEVFGTGSGKEIWKFRKRLAAESEGIADDVIDLVKGVENKGEVKVGKSKVDSLLKKGGKKVYLEDKYTIPKRPTEAETARARKAGGRTAFQRLVDQIEGAVAKGDGQVVVWSLKKPTALELKHLRLALGDEVFAKVKFLDGPEALYDWLLAHFGA
jgi:hypothetical protein